MNFSESMLPPETTHTTFPVPTFPASTGATDAAPAPSAMTLFSIAINFTASATSERLETTAPSSRSVSYTHLTLPTKA